MNSDSLFSLFILFAIIIYLVRGRQLNIPYLLGALVLIAVLTATIQLFL